MDATLRIRTPLPPRPTSASAAIDSTHRLLAALVDRDLGGAAVLFAPSACVWWSQRGELVNADGPTSIARALVELLDRGPPSRLAVQGLPRSAVTSAYDGDAIAWTLEIQVEDGAIIGAYVRGAKLTTAHALR